MHFKITKVGLILITAAVIIFAISALFMNQECIGCGLGVMLSIALGIAGLASAFSDSRS